MKITIIGCGSIGKIWLFNLASQGHDVQGWLREKKNNLIINIKNSNGDNFNKLIPCNNIKHLQKSQLIIVCLKAWQITYVLHSLLHLIPKTTPILLLNNGMGVIDELGELKHPLLSGITTISAWQKNNQVYYTTNGITHIGAANKIATSFHFIADILHNSISNVLWSDKIIIKCWYKLAANCIINPLTVKYNCKNGDLFKFSKEIENIFSEIYKIIITQYLKINKIELIEYIYNVINITSNNYSSMLQDIRNYRRTEIDYITGYLIKQAKKHNINIPKNNILFYLIKQIEQTNIKKNILSLNNNYLVDNLCK